jgi:hypothetical protein
MRSLVFFFNLLELVRKFTELHFAFPRYRLNVKRKRPNWDQLWRRLRETYRLFDKPRNVAVLDNFSETKERICRKLGVVSDLDINRISSKIKAEKSR